MKRKREFSEVASVGDSFCWKCFRTVLETNVVNHKIMVPNGITGKLIELNGGLKTVKDIIAKIEKVMVK